MTSSFQLSESKLVGIDIHSLKNREVMAFIPLVARFHNVGQHYPRQWGFWSSGEFKVF
jgi:hypothetical protein